MKKAVLLARGLGTRMRQADSAVLLDAEQEAIARTGLKAMIPIGRPFLDYVLSELADAGYEEVCVVIGPEHGVVKNHYMNVTPPRRTRISFAVQAEPRGTADAVLTVEEFVSGEDFLCMNSDNYYPVSVLRELRALNEPGMPLFDRLTLLTRGNISEEKIRKYAICEVGDDGYLRAIVEKPATPVMAAARGDALVSMNCWRFSAAIFEVCRHTPLSPRGEYELPVAVGEGIQLYGLRFRAVRCHEGVLDLSSRADIAVVAEKLRGVLANP
ncbi:MAG TPA: nucleotidyltransferase family protein [Candidatus Acidoferrum sp.]|nr:nucleotidyltransferase family protein [Candidatus Acidoferrum sp.]